MSGKLYVRVVDGTTVAGPVTVATATGGISGEFSNAPNGQHVTGPWTSFTAHHGPGSVYDPDAVVLTDVQVVAVPAIGAAGLTALGVSILICAALVLGRGRSIRGVAARALR